MQQQPIQPARIALFGGMFDPPHRGHIAIATAAADRFKLDKILFAPAGRQPLKSAAPGAEYEDRLAMVELATQADSRFGASSLDAPQPDGMPNYTVDTLSMLVNELGPDFDIYCITGADAFLDIRRWRQPDRLLELAQWIVVSRPGFSLKELPSLELNPRQLKQVHLLEGVAVDVSATHLREALHNGEDVDTDLAPGVSDYIREHRLYTR